MVMQNIDPETGVRFGVIAAQNLHPWVIELIENNGESLSYALAVKTINSEVQSEVARRLVAPEDALDEMARRREALELEEEVFYYGKFVDGPRAGKQGKLDVQTAWFGGAQHVYVLKSPFTTLARPCSPCAPNCGNLDERDDFGVLCYDVPPSWRLEAA